MHNYRAVYERGTVKPYCSCGWQGKKHKTGDEAFNEYIAHKTTAEGEGNSTKSA